MQNLDKLLSVASVFEKKSQQIPYAPKPRTQFPEASTPLLKVKPKPNPLLNLYKAVADFYTGVMRGTSDVSMKSYATNMAKITQTLFSKNKNKTLTGKDARILSVKLLDQILAIQRFLNKREQENPYDELLQVKPYLENIKALQQSYRPEGSAPVDLSSGERMVQNLGVSTPKVETNAGNPRLELDLAPGKQPNVSVPQGMPTFEGVGGAVRRT